MRSRRVDNLGIRRAEVNLIAGEIQVDHLIGLNWMTANGMLKIAEMEGQKMAAHLPTVSSPPLTVSTNDLVT